MRGERRRRWPVVIGAALVLALPWWAPVPARYTPAGYTPAGHTRVAAVIPPVPRNAAEPVLRSLLAQSAASVAIERAEAAALAADRQAGLRADEVPSVGSGALTAVPGAAAAPGRGPVRTVRVEIEGGLPVDPGVFAAFALATLNDPRGWGRGGAATFARADGPAEIVVVLASPVTSERLCRPLVTNRLLSCRSRERAVINFYRWVVGQPAFYGRDRTAYRQYVINHEVGHVLGHDHRSCPGPSQLAPVMQQQTLALGGCAPNPWPYP